MRDFPARAWHFLGRRVQQTLLANRYYNWYVFSRGLSNAWRLQMEKHYTASVRRTEGAEKIVVFLCNGLVENGGWADRLKGIVSTYEVCQELGIPFRLLFTSPCQLEDYLSPAGYDWRIGAADVVLEHPYAEVVTLEIGDESDYQWRKQHEWLKRRIATSRAAQVHVCTNASFCLKSDFAGRFAQLFRPSELLETSLRQQTAVLGDDYISVSARFVNSLGDFADTQQAPPLPAHLQRQLIDGCLTQIELLHENHPGRRILVNSDSTTFLRATERLEYAYTVPGEIIHLDTAPSRALYQLYEKTFLDFLLIARAAQVCRLETQWMRPSGFPYVASRVYGRPFHSVKF